MTPAPPPTPARDLTAKEWAIAYGVALLAMVLLDGFWLGAVARGFYVGQVGALMVSPIRAVPATVFCLSYPLAVVYFGLRPRPAGLWVAARRCALLGLFAYATCDLTNLATLAGWTLPLAVVDTLWGVAATAIAGTLACWFAKLAEDDLAGAPDPANERRRLL